MGYTTTFKGVLKFAQEPTVPQLRKLRSILGEDARDHPEWGDARGGKVPLAYIDLELSQDLDGLQWNGAEKSYEMERQVNFLVGAMRKEWPEFSLSGEMQAQGEDSEDAWTLVITPTSPAEKRKRELPGVKVRCPDCDHRFRVMPDGSVAS